MTSREEMHYRNLGVAAATENRRNNSGLFHDDGCVRGNIPVRPFRIIYEPVCEHTKIRAASVVVMAESEEWALWYGRETLRLPQTRLVGVEPVTDDE